MVELRIKASLLSSLDCFSAASRDSILASNSLNSCEDAGGALRGATDPAAWAYEVGAPTLGGMVDPEREEIDDWMVGVDLPAEIVFSSSLKYLAPGESSPVRIEIELGEASNMERRLGLGRGLMLEREM